MILIAPTAFKGTIGAAEAARAMAAGARRALPDVPVRELPLSDGGPGLIDALRLIRGGEVTPVQVTGPLGEPVTARVLRMDGTAVVESADACGMHLVPAERLDPLSTTTYGVGELLLAASGLDRRGRRGGGAGGGAAGRGAIPGAEAVWRILLGLGGSATVDGGLGMAAALGWNLLDMEGAHVRRGGAGLLDLARISRPADPPRLPSVVALADVRNPLLGPEGAAAVFGPQKGATPATVRRLELGLARLAARLEADIGVEVRELEGGGAAGGLGAAAVAFLGAELVPGSRWVLEEIGFDALLEGARLVVTGEGCYDAQSKMGKVVGVVVADARARGLPVLLVAGRIEGELPEGVTAVDGAGGILDEEALSRIVEREAARLLAR